MSKLYFTIALKFFVLTARGQVLNALDSVLMKFLAPAPESVFKSFREAGMDPDNHALTEVESAKVEAGFSVLTPLHRKILSTHLHYISFMDNMPNTALTSPVVCPDSVERFNITFRAGILHETISDRASKKENTLYEKIGSGEYTVSIEAGQLDAFVYVLLHEATHVVGRVRENDTTS